MSYQHLTMDERNVIFRMKILGHGQAETARCRGRDPGTISRELRRNANCDGRYLPGLAQTKAGVRRRAHIRRPKTGSVRLMAHVAERLGRRWSPQQIAGRLRRVGSGALGGVTISHQTIYRWIWSDPRRARQFRPYLRVAWKPRRKPYGKPSRRGQIPGRVSIEARPEVVEARERIGDWEADTLVGKGRSGYVATCVERASRYLVARKLHRCTAKQINAALHDGMRRLPAEKRQTLTVDNGREFAWHGRLAKLLGSEVYFAHPYTAWERGTCENTNGLMRQYLPKAIPFSELTDWQLESYVRALNNRPRKCLNYRTPAEVFWRRPVALTM
jgi:IS30 family transposase